MEQFEWRKFFLGRLWQFWRRFLVWWFQQFLIGGVWQLGHWFRQHVGRRIVRLWHFGERA